MPTQVPTNREIVEAIKAIAAYSGSLDTSEGRIHARFKSKQSGEDFGYFQADLSMPSGFSMGFAGTVRKHTPFGKFVERAFDVVQGVQRHQQRSIFGTQVEEEIGGFLFKVDPSNITFRGEIIQCLNRRDVLECPQGSQQADECREWSDEAAVTLNAVIGLATVIERDTDDIEARMHALVEASRDFVAQHAEALSEHGLEDKAPDAGFSPSP